MTGRATTAAARFVAQRTWAWAGALLAPRFGAVLCACLTAAVNAAAIRPWGVGVLALVGSVPAFLAISGAATAGRGALLAGLAALGVNSVAYEAARVLFPAAYPAALAAASLPFLLVGACAVGLRSAFTRWLDGRSSRLVTLAALPVLWTAAEWLPAQPGLLGVWALPLGFVGYSQVGLPTAAVARFGSVATVSLLVLSANASLAAGLSVLWSRYSVGMVPRRATGLAYLLPLTAAAALVGVVWASRGAEVPAEATTTHERTLSVLVVQPHLPDSAYYAARASRAERVALRRRLGDLAGRERVDLVVLPEAAWPGAIALEDLGDEAVAVASAFGASTVVFGAPARPAGGSGGVSNSVFVWGPGGLEHAYAKRRLVPIAEGMLRAGSSDGPFEVSGVSVAPLVCYDALFPADVRVAAAQGAQVIVLMTNDAFAAGSDIPELHLRAARMRAIEAGLPVVLASNTGPSALIGTDGEVVARLAGGRPGALAGEVEVSRSDSPYVRHGDWLGGANAVAAGGLALAAARGGRWHKRPT